MREVMMEEAMMAEVMMVEEEEDEVTMKEARMMVSIGLWFSARGPNVIIGNEHFRLPVGPHWLRALDETVFLQKCSLTLRRTLLAGVG
jgi:hypothetical protein